MSDTRSNPTMSDTRSNLTISDTRSNPTMSDTRSNLTMSDTRSNPTMSGATSNPAISDKNIKAEHVRSNKDMRRQMLPRTVCHGLVVFTLGLTISMRGPSFIDLQLISGTDVEQGSLYFTSSAFGYIIGALLTGIIYARVKVKDMLIIGPMILSAVIFAATPWCVNFVSMLVIHGAAAFFWALKETTVNTEEVKRWEGNSYSAMQFLSFSYSLGGIVGPLIVEPFLAPKSLAPTYNISEDHLTLDHVSPQNASRAAAVALGLAHVTESLSTTALYLLGQDHTNGSANLQSTDQLTHVLHGRHNRSVESSLGQTLASQSSIHYAYLIGGLTIVLSCAPLCVLHIRTRSSLQQKALRDEPQETYVRKLPLRMYILVTGAISMFYFFYTTVDDPYSMYLSIFVVSHLDWSKEDGAIVSSLYWGCSTVTKLFMILLVRYMNPSLVLFVSCLGMVVSMALLTVCAHFHIHFMIWLCTAFMAISQSPVFGGGFAWADAYLLQFDGTVTSCAMIFASLGAMLDPMLLGVAMQEWSPMAFAYLLTFQAFMTFIIFLAMLLIYKPYIARKYGLPREQGTDTSVVEQRDHLILDDTKHIHSTMTPNTFTPQ